MIQDPGDSGESSRAFAPIRIEQSQNPQYGARCVARRSLRSCEAIVRLSGALTRQNYRTIQIDKYRHLEEPRVLAFLNHSCHPTVLVDTNCLMVFAATDIIAGEELTFSILPQSGRWSGHSYVSAGLRSAFTISRARNTFRSTHWVVTSLMHT